jgi:triosephosphate isomerase
MRKPVIAANWKLQKTVAETGEFLDVFLPEVQGIEDAEIVIAPPYTALQSASERLKGTNVTLAAQNVFYEEKGAYTGEIAPGMIKELGCAYAIVGHSERRQYFGETEETVNRRIKAALGHGLKVIFCIGETLGQREAGSTNDVLKGQLDGGLKDIEIDDIVVAYEPVWAIGTGVTATTGQAQEAHAFIRGELRGKYADKAEGVRILYGGSVKPENVDDIMACPDVDGALVGGASLKPDSFAKLVKFRRSQK